MEDIPKILLILISKLFPCLHSRQKVYYICNIFEKWIFSESSFSKKLNILLLVYFKVKYKVF